VIGMTSLAEAKLCREAGMCYAAIALVTDYDVWKEDAEDVTVEVIVANLRKNARTAKAILKEAIPDIQGDRGCSCRNALEDAMVSDPGVLPDDYRSRYGVLLDSPTSEEGL